ncbi:hypothetical protein HN876_02585 [archaeon]|nr:hypothetical protein [archaeon]MBT7251779.1 hypothetical protein [archaeon]
MKHLTLLITILALFTFASCGGGGGDSTPPPPPDDELDTSFLDLDDPGTYEIDTNTQRKATVFDVRVFEGITFDQEAMTVTLQNPQHNYLVGDVFLFEVEGNQVGLTVTNATPAGQAMLYEVDPSQPNDLLDPGYLNFRVTPDWRDANPPPGAFLSSNGNSPIFDENGQFDLAGFEIFEIFVDGSGQIDVLNSSLMGIGLSGNEDQISESDFTSSPGGYFKATVVSGSLRITPTFDFEQDIHLTSFEIYQSVNAHILYDLEVELEASGQSTIKFEKSFFQRLSFPLPVTPPMEATFDIPAGFDFESEGESTVRVRYSSEYTHDFTMEYNSASGLLPQFTSERDFISEEQMISEIGELSIQGTLYLQPEVSVRILKVFGPFVWLKPYIQGVLNIPLQQNEDELFVGIEGGVGLVASIPFIWEGSLYSPDILDIPPLSWDLIGPNNGGNGSNTPPTANNSWVDTHQGVSKLVQLQASDLEQSTLFYSIEGLPQNGTLGNLNTLAGEVYYIPEEYFLGVDSFEFSAFDGYEESNIATVTITVTEQGEVSGDLVWAKSAGGSERDGGHSVAPLEDGSSIIIGTIRGTATFGAGEPNETTLVSSGGEINNLFIARYNSDGTLAWAKQEDLSNEGTSEMPLQVKALQEGKFAITGMFRDTAILGAGEPNETTLINSYSEGLSFFIARYNSDGTLAWAKQAQGDWSAGSSITSFSNGDLGVIGLFWDTAILGAGEPNETTLISERSDVFIARYNSDGTLAWAKQTNANDLDWTINRGPAIASLLGDSLAVTGFFNGEIIFGAGEPNETTLMHSYSGYGIFVASYNFAGSLQWVKQAVGENEGALFGDVGVSITSLQGASLGITGGFEGEATFGAGEPNETTLTSFGGSDIFIASYNPNGTLQWVKQAGGSEDNFPGMASDWSNSITVLSDNSPVLTGGFRGEATFGAGEPNETVLTSAGSYDVFIARYNLDGTLAWAKQAGGGEFAGGSSITVFQNGDIAVTGSFGEFSSGGEATFGAGEPNETVLTSAGSYDIFVARFKP